MWEWMFGSGDDGGYERYMSALYLQQQHARVPDMCCTHHCDLCYKQVKLGEQKTHTLGTFCAKCYNTVGRVERLTRNAKEAAMCTNRRNEDKEEIARLKDHVSKLQGMIVKLMN